MRVDRNGLIEFSVALLKYTPTIQKSFGTNESVNRMLTLCIINLLLKKNSLRVITHMHN